MFYHLRLSLGPRTFYRQLRLGGEGHPSRFPSLEAHAAERPLVPI